MARDDGQKVSEEIKVRPVPPRSTARSDADTGRTDDAFGCFGDPLFVGGIELAFFPAASVERTAPPGRGEVFRLLGAPRSGSPWRAVRSRGSEPDCALGVEHHERKLVAAIPPPPLFPPDKRGARCARDPGIDLAV